jgi:hypothetical protein
MRSSFRVLANGLKANASQPARDVESGAGRSGGKRNLLLPR